jgi:hypothetical protein
MIIRTHNHIGCILIHTENKENKRREKNRKEKKEERKESKYFRALNRITATVVESHSVSKGPKAINFIAARPFIWAQECTDQLKLFGRIY